MSAEPLTTHVLKNDETTARRHFTVPPLMKLRLYRGPGSPLQGQEFWE